MSADTEGEPPPRTPDQWDSDDAEAIIWLDFELGPEGDDPEDWYAAQRILLAERAPA